MFYDHSGKHFLVTGASRGIGQSIAVELLNEGALVTLAGRGIAGLQETVTLAAPDSSHRGVIYELDLGDVTDFDSIVAAVAGEIPLDGVVHAAGLQLRKPAVEVTSEDLRRVMRVNLEAPFLLSTSIARHQIAAGIGGSHVFIGSLGSSIAIPQAAPYTLSKAGVLGAIRVLSNELATAGIRVNAANPGYVETKLTSDLLNRPEQRSRLLGRTPMARFGTPEEIASVVSFLLSPASAYMTGESLNVDGGWLAS